MRDSRNYVPFFVLVLLASALFFLGLGTPGLFDADEPAYAGAAREMLERGDWVTPYFNGQPRFDKPILFYWLILLSYRVFGITEFAVRVWSASRSSASRSPLTNGRAESRASCTASVRPRWPR